MSKILMTAHSDAFAHTLERLGGKDVVTIAHFGGLYYRQWRNTKSLDIDLPTYYRDLALLSKIVDEGEHEVVVLSGSTEPIISFATLDIARFLLENTIASYVILLSVKSLPKERFNAQIFVMADKGITLLDSLVGVSGDELFRYTIDVAKKFLI
jgi:hypothetical protein